MIEFSAIEFLAFAALAIAGGVAIGIALGIKLYERCGK